MDQMGDALSAGPLVLDQAARQVHYAGTSVHLTRTEYEILAILMGSPKRVFTRQQLVDQVWGPEWTHMDHSINVHVSNLRRKIHARLTDAAMITTLRGVGYRFDAPVTRRSHADVAAERYQSDLISEPLHTREFPPGVSTITMAFDATCTLLKVSADTTGDLVDTTHHVAGFFTPTLGFDDEKVRLLLSSLAGSGVRELVGTTEVTRQDGSSAVAACRTVLDCDSGGSFQGCVAYLVIPARSESQSYPAIDSRDPVDDSHRASNR